jgi:AbrB family looped-hinge helix DNA binding protein
MSKKAAVRISQAKLSSKNQIVIPAEARRALQLRPGDKILVVVRGDRVIVLQKPKSHRNTLRGLGRGLFSKRYLAKERASWD